MKSTTSVTTSTPKERFQILALDGGGVKALFTAHVLARIEEDLKISIRDTFDLISGTSAGGIIALGLGAGLTPRAIADKFENLATAVFPQRRRKLRYLAPWRNAYSQEALRDALLQVVGDRRLGDSDKRLVIPSWDLQRGQVHIFKTRHSERYTRDYKVSMVDVALATSAAPTYLPAARVDGQRLIDGGVWANNPSVIAIVEAMSALEVPLTSLRVLNVGTTSEVTSRSSRLDSGGLFQWAKEATPLVVTASSRGTQGTAQHLVGTGNYVRFDADVAHGLYALDSVDHDSIAGLAAGTSRDLSPRFSATFEGHTAASFVPIPAPSLEVMR